MDFKQPEYILEFIRFQKTILKKYRSFINNLILTNYKKSAIFAYWLNDYIEYIKAETLFNPSMNITYKRGQIVYVNFGYRIGNEIGGPHYALVIDVKNSRSSRTLTVIPLKSKKDKQTRYSEIYHLPLGTCIKDLLVDKSTSIMNTEFNAALNVAKQISEQHDAEVSIDTKRKLEKLKRNRRIALDILKFTEKLKSETVADIGQIVTISKQRIQHPCKTDDVLTNIIVPKDLMDCINEKMQLLYIESNKEDSI